MFKKFFTYPVFLVIFLSIIILILFGSLLRHHYLGGDRAKPLRMTAVFLAEVPKNLRDMIKYGTINLGKPQKLKKHFDKKRFQNFLSSERNALLVLPRYDYILNRSVVDIVDLRNFEIIHSYKHDINEMHKQVKNIEEFPRINIDDSPIRFEYRHPLILDDGSLISDSDYSVEFKIDFCSNLKWINDQEIFHHSKMLDHEGNIWVPAQMNPKSEHVKKYKLTGLDSFWDDAAVKIDIDGKILYKKSVSEILIENKILPKNFPFYSHVLSVRDPIHLNDIEPVFRDTKYWKKGDILLSTPALSAIIHFRPSDNKLINYITGPFSQQHDVDIISDKEISIFNNNTFLDNNEHSEVIIYNFETNEFKKLFNDQLKKENFKTHTQGLSHIFKDGALMVEEQNHGRIILFNNQGKKEWEFINKDENGDIGYIAWSRVIENEFFIEKFRSLVENKKCSN